MPVLLCYTKTVIISSWASKTYAYILLKSVVPWQVFIMLPSQIWASN